MFSDKITFQNLHIRPPFTAKTSEQLKDYKINKTLQTQNFFFSSLTAKLIVKSFFTPLQRFHTLVLCNKEIGIQPIKNSIDAFQSILISDFSKSGIPGDFQRNGFKLFFGCFWRNVLSFDSISWI